MTTPFEAVETLKQEIVDELVKAGEDQALAAAIVGEVFDTVIDQSAATGDLPGLNLDDDAVTALRERMEAIVARFPADH